MGIYIRSYVLVEVVHERLPPPTETQNYYLELKMIMLKIVGYKLTPPPPKKKKKNGTQPITNYDAHCKILMNVVSTFSGVIFLFAPNYESNTHNRGLTFLSLFSF